MFGINPGDPPKGPALAIRAYNMLDFASIDQIAEVLGYDDMELLVTQIETIRSFQRQA